MERDRLPASRPLRRVSSLLSLRRVSSVLSLRRGLSLPRPGSVRARSATALALILMLLLPACTRTVYTPVEKTVYHTDTLRQTALRVDSVLQRDSVAVYINGDTVRITQFRDRIRYRERTDTLYRAVTDTARIEVPVPVERELTRWEQAKMDLGGLAFGAIGLAVLVLLAWLAIRFHIRRRRQ